MPYPNPDIISFLLRNNISKDGLIPKTLPGNNGSGSDVGNKAKQSVYNEDTQKTIKPERKWWSVSKNFVKQSSTDNPKIRKPLLNGEHLSTTGVDTKFGSIRYSNIADLALLLIANKKITSIKPVYKKFAPSYVPVVTAKRGLEASSLASSRREIAMLDSNRGATSDPVMQLITNQVTNSSRTALKNQIFSKIGENDRAESNRVLKEQAARNEAEVKNRIERTSNLNDNALLARKYETEAATAEQLRRTNLLKGLGDIANNMANNAEAENLVRKEFKYKKSALDYSSGLDSKQASIDRALLELKAIEDNKKIALIKHRQNEGSMSGADYKRGLELINQNYDTSGKLEEINNFSAELEKYKTDYDIDKEYNKYSKNTPLLIKYR